MTMPTAEDWRALARSSPWLWRSVEFELDWPARHWPATSGQPLHAWLRRPAEVRVTGPGDTLSGGVAPGRDFGPQPPDRPATLRPDGLVLTRTSGMAGDDHGLYFHNYYWLAILDPYELADGEVWVPEDAAEEFGPGRLETVPGTEIGEVSASARFGRETWWAWVRPTAAYQPRCSCCALLYGEVAERLDNNGQLRPQSHAPGYAYSTQWLVGLDRATGLPVSIDALDGSATGHTMRILGHEPPDQKAV